MKYALIVLLFTATAWSQPPGYSAVRSEMTRTRFDAYIDTFKVLWESTVTFRVLTSTQSVGAGCDGCVIGAGCDGCVSGIWNLYGSPWNVIMNPNDTEQFVEDIGREVKNQVIHEILDNEIEQYMVYPSTFLPPHQVGVWRGLCRGPIARVPVPCP